MIRGIAFDAGGVLLIIKDVKLKTEELLKDYFPSINYNKYRKNFMIFNEKAQTIKNYSYERAIRDCLNSLGIKNEKKIGLFVKELSNIKPEIICNCEILFKYLKDRNLKIIILSNTHYTSSSARRFFQCKNREVSKMIDFIINSKDVGCKKPCSKIFEYAAKKVGLNYNEILFISDDRKEISGAKNLGFKTLFFSNEKKNDGIYLKSRLERFL